MKEKKGFTLIELLAVIVIIAVVTIISVPIINHMIRKAKEKAFLNSAYGVLDAAEYYYTRSQMNLVYNEEKIVPLANKTEKNANVNVLTTDKIEKISLPNNDKIKIKGKIDNGTVYIKSKGSIALSLWNDNLKLCAIKNYTENEITIGDRELTKEECVEGNLVESKTESGMIWDGFITLTLYYPENSTDRKYRIGEPGEVREEDWIDYEGAITIPLKDVENVYIKYKINGKTYIIPPKGTIYVDIEPSSFEIPKTGGKVVSKINATEGSDIYYKTGSTWERYDKTKLIEVTNPSIIEAKAEKLEDVYDSDGNKAYTRKITAYDSVYIREKGTNVGTSGSKQDQSSGSSSGSSSASVIRDEETGLIIPSYYIKGPIINVTPTDLTDEVEVSLSTKETARKIYIKVGNNSYKEYTDPITINSNTNIYAYYVRESDGATSSISSKRITNIYKKGYNCNLPNISINQEPGLNHKYVNKVTLNITTDGNDLEYSSNGVEYQKYKDKLEIKENKRIYAKASNDCGTQVEYIDITNIGEKGVITPPVRKQKLNVEINVNPEPATSTELVKEVTVSINYDSKATKRYYKIGTNGKLMEYSNPFKVEENETIYAYAINTTGYGEDSKLIDNIGNNETNTKKGLTNPIITAYPDNLNQANSVDVNITFDKNATIKKYRIGNGSLRDYNGSFKVDKNETIYAVNIDSDGNKKDAIYEIKNIVNKQPIYMIDYGNYFIIKLNYPSSSKASSREYRFGNNDWTKYKEEGILLATKDTNLKKDGKIIIKDENGVEKEFKGDFYYIDCSPSEIMEKLFMRWDTGKPKTPEIIVVPNDPTRKAKVKIMYDNTSKLKEYKLVLKDGTTKGWMKYTNEIDVNSKNTVIYARSRNESEVYSNTAIKEITNIDEEPPVINLTANLTNKTQSLNVRVNVTDDVLVDTVMYEKGLKGESYFKTGGKLIENNSIVKLTENGEYTFYAKDSVGNEQTYTILVENIDNDPPSIKITDNSSKQGIETSITIDYGDSKTKKYKIGKNTTSWTNYTDTFTLTSNTVISKNLGNSDNTVTICAQGIDSVGNKKEECLDILTLDIDAPKVPVINANANYPVLTEYGVKYDGRTTINYDKRKDIDNYYSLDGKEWTKYTGTFEVTSGTIYAKSVKKSTGLEVAATKTIVVPSDALPLVAYDGNVNTYFDGSGYGSTLYINISPEIINKTIGINWGKHLFSVATVQFLDGNNNVLNGGFSYGKNQQFAEHIVTNLVVPEGARRIKIYLSTNDYWSRINEIYINNEPQLNINTNNIYPKITEYGIKDGYSIIKSINFFQTTRKKLYKVDDGEWKQYNGESIGLEYNQTIYVKGIDKNNVESMISTYTSKRPNDALTAVAYDGNVNTYFDGSRYGSTLYFDISSEVINKTIGINWGKHLYSVASVQFLDENNKTLSGGFNYGKNQQFAEHIITNLVVPEGAKRVKIYLSTNDYWSRINEIYINNEPQLNINTNNIYPKITEYGIKDGYSIIKSINFFQTTRKKLYKVDDGEWKQYNGESIGLEYNQTIYVKGIDKNNVESMISTYTSKRPNDALTAVAYDGNVNTYFDGSRYGSTLYFDISSEVINKTIGINWGKHLYSVASVQFLDENNKTLSGGFNYGKNQQFAEHIITNLVVPEGAKRVKIYLSTNDYWSRINEIYLKED